MARVGSGHSRRPILSGVSSVARPSRRRICLVMNEGGDACNIEFSPSVLNDIYTRLVTAANAQPSELNGQKKVKIFQIGSSLFKDVPKHALVDVYEALMAYLPTYLESHPEHKDWKVNGCKLSQFMSKCFVDYLNSAWSSQTARQAHKVADLSVNVIESEEEIAEREAQNAARLSMVKRVLDILVPMEFPNQEKYWRHAFVMLKLKPFERQFVEFICEKTSKGEASGAVISFCIRNDYLNKYITSLKFIVQACLLGAVSGNDLESYFTGLPKEKRRQCRALMVYLHDLCNKKDYDYLSRLRDFFSKSEAVQNLATNTPQFNIHYEQFKLRMQEVMRVLKSQSSHTKIDMQWAKKCVKDHIKKFYDGRTSYEQMYDLVFNVICQRRTLKPVVVSLLRKDGHHDEADYWDYLQLGRGYTTFIPIIEPQRIPHIYTGFEEPNVLTLPRNVDVTIVDGIDALHEAFRAFEKAAASDFPFVGVDAEWTAYHPDARASVLQVALADQVYIFDLDTLPREQNAKIFKALFGNEKLIKVGFQFNEDLMKLRKVSPVSETLYSPRSLICISVVIATVQFLAQQRNESVISIPSSEKKEVDGSLPIAALAAKLKGVGLAKLVKEFLDVGLDKSEQCSVWNRRPLRYAQIRYGALDAYCLVLMVQKCLSIVNQWSKELVSLVRPHYVVPSPMPLFFSVDCDPTLYPPVDIEQVLTALAAK
uniref:3'-5' exonuclease domain-containing protein n=1 Tax=Steinernema glaseri TaxID=37863 RepID=A0A1I7YDI7_9BILA